MCLRSCSKNVRVVMILVENDDVVGIGRDVLQPFENLMGSFGKSSG